MYHFCLSWIIRLSLEFILIGLDFITRSDHEPMTVAATQKMPIGLCQLSWSQDVFPDVSPEV